MDEEENGTGGTHTECRVEPNLRPFARHRSGSRAVRPKSNPPSCKSNLSAPYILKIAVEVISIEVVKGKIIHNQIVGCCIPAFFSCKVISFQSTFMRSLSCIQSSACSCGGMVSHLFSIPAKVGLDMACADLVDCRGWLVT